MQPARRMMTQQMKVGWLAAVGCCAAVVVVATQAAEVTIRVDNRMDPPKWAVLERQLLAENIPAAQEFFNK
jgi:hypothetical protein